MLLQEAYLYITHNLKYLHEKVKYLRLKIMKIILIIKIIANNKINKSYFLNSMYGYYFDKKKILIQKHNVTCLHAALG